MMLIVDKSIASAHPIVVNQYHLLHHRRQKYHEPSTRPELHQRNQREEGERCTRWVLSKKVVTFNAIYKNNTKL
jgi:hypothetical protein